MSDIKIALSWFNYKWTAQETENFCPKKTSIWFIECHLASHLDKQLILGFQWCRLFLIAHGNTFIVIFRIVHD